MYSKTRLLAGFCMALGFFFIILMGTGTMVHASEVNPHSQTLSMREVACQSPPEEMPMVVESVRRDFEPTTNPTTQPTVETAQTEAPAPLLNPEIIFNLINQHRTSVGLPAFEKNDQLCAVARSREGQLASEMSTGQIHAGFRALKLPYWATENMKLGSSEQNVVNWWLASPIHRKAIMGNHTYSCGTCAGRVCIQLFTSFAPKK